MAYTPLSSKLTPRNQVLPVVSDGQTSFTLTYVPAASSKVKLRVNDIPYLEGEEFTRAGNTLSWLDPFPLSTSDEVTAEYFS